MFLTFFKTNLLTALFLTLLIIGCSSNTESKKEIKIEKFSYENCQIRASIDQVNGKTFKGNIELDKEVITLKGWAFNKVTKGPFDKLFIKIGNQVIPANSYEKPRADVAKVFKALKSTKIGFTFKVPSSKINLLEKELIIVGYTEVGKEYCDNPISLTLDQSQSKK